VLQFSLTNNGPALLVYLALVVAAGLITSAWLERRHGSVAMFAISAAIFAGAAAAIPPWVVPTIYGPGFTSTLESVLVGVAAATALLVCWLARSAGLAAVPTMLAVELVAFVVGLEGVNLSLPPCCGG
jgi:hypothetical protein